MKNYKCNTCGHLWETEDVETMQCPICRSFDIAEDFPTLNMKDILLKAFVRWLYEGGFEIVLADRISREIPQIGEVEFSVDDVIKLFGLTKEYQETLNKN